MRDIAHFIIDNYQSSDEFLRGSNEMTKYGSYSLEMVYCCEIIEKYLNPGQETKPHLFCQLLKYFLSVISSEDPTRFHQDIAKKALTVIDETALNDDEAIDRLARAFVEACNKLYKKIKIPIAFENYITCCRKEALCENDIASHIIIHEYSENSEELKKYFLDNFSVSIWDSAYLKLLKSFGSSGRKESDTIAKKIFTNEWSQNSWFRKPDIENGNYFFHSSAFLVLAAVLWKDGVKQKVNFAKKQVASLTTNIQGTVGRVLSRRNEIIRTDQQVQLVNNGDLVSVINIPSIPISVVPTVFKGIPKLNSVYGHKLFRYEVQEPFRKFSAGDCDYRVIKIDGGSKELTRLLGFNGHAAEEAIAAILQAQSHLNFSHANISGNLIQLTSYVSPKTKRNDGLLITVGTMILPYRTFEDYRSGHNGLLIPLLSDPPLIGAPRYHATLYSLQMEVMAEFSRQSIEFYRFEGIQIAQTKWEEMCRACGVPKPMAAQVLERWSKDGNEGAKFLNMIEPNFYSLGPDYSNALAFLIEQGKKRLQASEAGKKSYQGKCKKQQIRSGER